MFHIMCGYIVPMDCSEPFHEVTEPGTIVTSPNYPNEYQNNKDCGTKIRFPPGERVVLEVQDFNVEHHSACVWDYVEVKDGDNANSSRIEPKLCGSAIPRPILSSGNTLSIRFKTDDEMTHSGFKMKVDRRKLKYCV